MTARESGTGAEGAGRYSDETAETLALTVESAVAAIAAVLADAIGPADSFEARDLGRDIIMRGQLRWERGES